MSASVDKSTQLDERVARVIAEKLRHVRFGSITIMVHEGAVTEVHATEKTRLAPQK